MFDGLRDMANAFDQVQPGTESAFWGLQGAESEKSGIAGMCD